VYRLLQHHRMLFTSKGISPLLLSEIQSSLSATSKGFITSIVERGKQLDASNETPLEHRHEDDNYDWEQGPPLPDNGELGHMQAQNHVPETIESNCDTSLPQVQTTTERGVQPKPRPRPRPIPKSSTAPIVLDQVLEDVDEQAELSLDPLADTPDEAEHAMDPPAEGDQVLHDVEEQAEVSWDPQADAPDEDEQAKPALDSFTEDNFAIGPAAEPEQAPPADAPDEFKAVIADSAASAKSLSTIELLGENSATAEPASASIAPQADDDRCCAPAMAEMTASQPTNEQPADVANTSDLQSLPIIERDSDSILTHLAKLTAKISSEINNNSAVDAIAGAGSSKFSACVAAMQHVEEAIGRSKSAEQREFLAQIIEILRWTTGAASLVADDGTRTQE
jgi:hypothetical protein